MKDWRKIFSSQNPFQAELVRDVLEGNDFQAITVNKQDSAYGVFGEIEVYVPKESVLPALKIIKDEISFE